MGIGGKPCWKLVQGVRGRLSERATGRLGVVDVSVDFKPKLSPFVGKGFHQALWPKPLEDKGQLPCKVPGVVHRIVSCPGRRGEVRFGPHRQSACRALCGTIPQPHCLYLAVFSHCGSDNVVPDCLTMHNFSQYQPGDARSFRRRGARWFWSASKDWVAEIKAEFNERHRRSEKGSVSLGGGDQSI